MKGIPAIILSAGGSRRMGFPKALVKVGHSTLLEDQIRRLRKAGCSTVIVVIGADAKRIIKEGPSSRYIVNRRWRLGQFSSIKCGLRAIKDVSSGCVVLPIDVPFVPIRTIKSILNEAKKGRLDAVIPSFKGRRGHPVWISPDVIKRISRTSSRHGRLDHILAMLEEARSLNAGSGSILNNVNTMELFIGSFGK